MNTINIKATNMELTGAINDYINKRLAGIEKFIGNNEKGILKKYRIADWVSDWQKNEDITLDKERYRTEYGKKKG
jgi:ribosome-associated translation inhibitor RaiA